MIIAIILIFLITVFFFWKWFIYVENTKSNSLTSRWYDYQGFKREFNKLQWEVDEEKNILFGKTRESEINDNLFRIKNRGLLLKPLDLIKVIFYIENYKLNR